MHLPNYAMYYAFLHCLHKLGNIVPIPAAEAFLQHLLDSTGLQLNAILHTFHSPVPSFGPICGNLFTCVIKITFLRV